MKNDRIKLIERPLITLVVCAYNQEKYIKDAVNGAFTQTYTPLEIVLSDDCSPDSTFEIMREMARSYKGPHYIKLNRNTSNLGIGGHVACLEKHISGNWVILSAGDDVSLPERARNTFLESENNKNVKAVAFNFIEINESGAVLSNSHSYEFAQSDSYNFSTLEARSLLPRCGAVFSYHKKCLSWPTLYPKECWYEDIVLPFRAALLGRVILKSEAMVLHRIFKSRKLPTERVNHISQVQNAIAECRRSVLFAKNTSLITQQEANQLLSYLAWHNYRATLWGDICIEKRVISRLFKKAILKTCSMTLFRGFQKVLSSHKSP